MKLSQIVKEFRRKNGWSMDYLAEKAGVSKAYISMIENDMNPRTGKPIKPLFPTLQKLAKAMHMTTDELVGMLDDDTVVSFEPEHIEPEKTMAKIPLYGPLCCGNGAFVDDNVVDYVSLPVDRLNPRIEYFCQIAQGDSMIGAGIHDGDVLVFEKSSSIDSGQIGCFCIDDNDAVCKRYKVLSDSQILLMPANDKYDPIPVDVLSHSFRCLGILRWAICDMDGR